MGKRQPPAASSEPQAHAELASVGGMKAEDLKKLLAEVADLRKKLDISEAARTEAEAAALAAAQAQSTLSQREISEVPTGKFVFVNRAVDEEGNPAYKTVGYKDNGSDILKPVWRKVKLPTYFYKIELPPVGGEGLAISGLPLYHGAVYTLDIDTLRTVKDMVYRVWEHERAISGSNENFYRKKQDRSISMR